MKAWLYFIGCIVSTLAWGAFSWAFRRRRSHDVGSVSESWRGERLRNRRD